MYRYSMNTKEKFENMGITEIVRVEEGNGHVAIVVPYATNVYAQLRKVGFSVKKTQDLFYFTKEKAVRVTLF